MNEENEREIRVYQVETVEQNVGVNNKEELRKALKMMRSGTTVVADDIPVEVWKCLENRAVELSTKQFNINLDNEKMPEEWRKSILY